MNISQMLERRRELTAELDGLNKAIALLGDQGKPVSVRTHKNLRNTGLSYTSPEGEWTPVTVYKTEKLKVRQYEGAHDGFISAHDAAAILAGYDEDYLYDWGVSLQD